MELVPAVRKFVVRETARAWAASADLASLGRDRDADLHRAVAEKVVLITGASSGIGEATARRVASAGGTALLVARSCDNLDRVAAEIEDAGGNAVVYQCDLTDLEAIARLAETVLEEHGTVDVLVNNAGRSIRRAIAKSIDRIHDYERTMQVNYLGAVQMTLKLLPAMREAGRGHVVMVSTMGTQVVTPRFSAYVASKAALEAFAVTLAAENRHRGIKVSTINMPLVRTPMIEPTAAYDGMPSLSSAQAADLVCSAIANPRTRVAPLMGALSEIGNAVAPGVRDRALNALYRATPH
jgi:short-subunit dehydrogenase